MEEYQNFEDVEQFPMTDSERRPLSRDAEENTDKESRPLIVFETLSQYDCIVWIILTIALLSVIFPLYFIWFDHSVSAEEKQESLGSLGFSLFSIIVVFALVLPTSLQVRSDGSIGVKTIFHITWYFSEVTAAEVETSLCSDRCGRPRFKFATSLTSNRVLVLRRRGKWDILVSPRDVGGFVEAVQTVAASTQASSAQD